jgi:hypothetical protein
MTSHDELGVRPYLDDPALTYHQRLGDIARKFQSFFNLICCREQLSGDLQGELCNRDW